MRGANDSGARYADVFSSIVTLLLLVAVIGLGIFGGNAMKYQSSAHDLFVRKLQVECSTALQLCNTLSRTAGSGSSGTLGKIRQHIYGMQTINDLNVGLSGSSGWLVQETYFSQPVFHAGRVRNEADHRHDHGRLSDPAAANADEPVYAGAGAGIIRVIRGGGSFGSFLRREFCAKKICRDGRKRGGRTLLCLKQSTNCGMRRGKDVTI